MASSVSQTDWLEVELQGELDHPWRTEAKYTGAGSIPQVGGLLSGSSGGGSHDRVLIRKTEHAAERVFGRVVVGEIHNVKETNARLQLRQVEEVAPVDGQVFNLFGADDALYRSLFGIHFHYIRYRFDELAGRNHHSYRYQGERCEHPV